MKTSLSLSEMAVQMENLLHALIPFKRASLSGLEASKKQDLEQTAAWWDKLIENAREELTILLDHAEALGIDMTEPERIPGERDPTAPPLTEEERLIMEGPRP